ncbi:hypothetical protein C1H46_001746 [Malus baccata]|uniref:Uncharacterized protein n=1 Tax=Malus baccata TaxID=106549 RepID=A0A540NND3_MALBA|nr:hypothetical protein C1H46_001746 [Malus baccata]
MAEMEGRGRHGNQEPGDLRVERDDKIQELRQEIELLALRIERLEAQRKHGGSKRKKHNQRWWTTQMSRFGSWLEDARSCPVRCESDKVNPNTYQNEQMVMPKVSDLKVTPLVSLIFENEFDNDELGYTYDCTLPPIYDEYPENGDICPKKEVTDESLHHNKLGYSSIDISDASESVSLHNFMSCSKGDLEAKGFANPCSGSNDVFLVHGRDGTMSADLIPCNIISLDASNITNYTTYLPTVEEKVPNFQFYDSIWYDFIYGSINNYLNARKELIMIL